MTARFDDAGFGELLPGELPFVLDVSYEPFFQWHFVNKNDVIVSSTATISCTFDDLPDQN